MRKIMPVIFLACFLTACSNEVNYAPVTDISTIEHIPKNGMYRVLPGETLYSIAWRYGLDYRYLANLNHIAPPFHVVSGQRIYLSQQFMHQKSFIKSTQQKNISVPPKQVHSTTHVTPYFIERDSNKPVHAWLWPARGPVTGGYSSLNKGVNIGGLKGNPVYATAAGQVVYSGNGLRGYGNLIIIKHNSTFLSAYAHNSTVLVKEGQQVKAGQEIAEMGGLGLHFEIRRNGRPVNPVHYLGLR